MMARTLAAAAHEVQGRLVGADQPFGVVTTDTRALGPGALFVAIPGDRFDGNDFIADAFAKKAAGALVSRLAASPLPQIEVRDSRRALGALAKAWRASFAIPAVAVTGSSGKTTVKELIAAILSVSRSVCVTQGNLNNDIGVPLTLLRLTAEHDALVVELGANHLGEIDYLASLAQPTVGVITNAAEAHLEGFGSLDGVCRAKGELLEAHLRQKNSFGGQRSRARQSRRIARRRDRLRRAGDVRRRRAAHGGRHDHPGGGPRARGRGRAGRRAPAAAAELGSPRFRAAPQRRGRRG